MFNVAFSLVYKTTVHLFWSPFSPSNTLVPSLTSSCVYLELNDIFYRTAELPPNAQLFSPWAYKAKEAQAWKPNKAEPRNLAGKTPS